MKRCPQCWQFHDLLDFVSPKDGHIMQDCALCRARRKLRLTVVNHRTGLSTKGEPRFKLVPRSHNRKVGAIPEVWASASTCPTSCPLYNRGCYGESGPMRHHWRHVDRKGVDAVALLDFVRLLPAGQLWRYGVVGDLPGVGDEVDYDLLHALTVANMGKRGFGFSHKKSPGGLIAARRSTDHGFTINLSADTLHEADDLARVGPVAVVLPIDAPERLQTPRGLPVLRCPATVREGVTCATCGLCSISNERRPIIGFPAHGLRRREVSEMAAGVSRGLG